MKIRWPEAEFHGESEFFVKKGVAPQKLGKKRKKLFSYRKSNKNAIFFSRREVGTPIFSRGKSARRVFRAGGRRGDFFVRAVRAVQRTRTAQARTRTGPYPFGPGPYPYPRSGCPGGSGGAGAPPAKKDFLITKIF